VHLGVGAIYSNYKGTSAVTDVTMTTNMRR
jgi:hypothetical protein